MSMVRKLVSFYMPICSLLAENEEDLQCTLNILSVWCGQNDMNVNCTESNIVHFRLPSQRRTAYVFSCCNEIKDSYMYLGLLLHEFLEYNSKDCRSDCK